MKSLLAIAVTAALSGCAIIVESGSDGDGHVHIASMATTRGSGVITTEARTLGAVDQIRVTGPVDVDVTIDAQPSMTVSGDDNLVPMVHTKQEGHTLVIGVDGSFSSHNRLKVTVVSPSLAAVDVRGSGDISVNGLNGGSFELASTGSGDTKLAGRIDALSVSMSGSGDLRAMELAARQVSIDQAGSGDAHLRAEDADRFTANLRGSGNLEARGQVKRLTGSLVGSGNMSLGKLMAEDVDLSEAGSGSISAVASHTARAIASGSGSIEVHGNPRPLEVVGKHVHIGQ